MASPAVTYTFSNSTTADATQVNQNFTDLINGLTDGTKDLSISALTVAGTATLNGNVTLGNSSADVLTVTASLSGSLAMGTTFTSDFGSATVGLKSVYLGSNDSAAKTVRVIAPVVGTSYTLTLPTTGGTADYVLKTDGSGTTSWRSWTAPTVSTALVTGTGTGTGGFVSGTYTTPANVKWIRVRMVGGGGGGGGGQANGSGGANGTSGGNTTFGSSTANGGSYASAYVGGSGGSFTISGGTGKGTSGATGSGGGYLAAGFSGLVVQGAVGASSLLGGAGATALNDNGQDARANTGSGGGGGAASTTGSASASGGGGGAGGHIDMVIIAPSATYSYSVGALGTGGTLGSGYAAGGAGGLGAIIVEEYYQ